MTTRLWRVLGSSAAAVVTAVAILVWLTSWRTAAIPDVTQPADLEAVAGLGDGMPLLGVTGISFRVTGEIDGEAEVWFGNGSPRQVAGRVDHQFGGDWFQTTCDFHYRPKGVTSGRLRVRYQFR